MTKRMNISNAKVIEKLELMVSTLNSLKSNLDDLKIFGYSGFAIAIIDEQLYSLALINQQLISMTGNSFGKLILKDRVLNTYNKIENFFTVEMAIKTLKTYAQQYNHELKSLNNRDLLPIIVERKEKKVANTQPTVKETFVKECVKDVKESIERYGIITREQFRDIYTNRMNNEFNGDLQEFANFLFDYRHTVSSGIEWDVCSEFIEKARKQEEFYQERANTIATIEEINETYANIEKELEVKNAHETETVLENELSTEYTVKLQGCSFTINSRDKFYIQDNEGYTLYCGELTENKKVFVKAITTIQEITKGKFKTVFEVIRLARKHVYNRMIRKATKLKECSCNTPSIDTLSDNEIITGINNLLVSEGIRLVKPKPSYTLNSYIKDLKKEAIDYKIEYFLAKKKYYDNPSERKVHELNQILRDEKETIIELGICKQRKFLVKNYLDILKEF